MCKVEPIGVKNNEDVKSFILEQVEDNKYWVPLCVTMIKKSESIAGNDIYVHSDGDVED